MSVAQKSPRGVDYIVITAGQWLTQDGAPLTDEEAEILWAFAQRLVEAGSAHRFQGYRPGDADPQQLEPPFDGGAA
jgi:hypothetical protein